MSRQTSQKSNAKYLFRSPCFGTYRIMLGPYFSNHYCCHPAHSRRYRRPLLCSSHLYFVLSYSSYPCHLDLTLTGPTNEFLSYNTPFGCPTACQHAFMKLIQHYGIQNMISSARGHTRTWMDDVVVDFCFPMISCD